ncbi:class I SAM-dependent methyltransferase [sulfur-oxidizing endosymbiont of Gigantopelta aegis]|uniref:class I SAM-dependent methyltransferase n=1 Tax=sulfur-oxidizing endosymbiont of Gigantopelta aegis TaxID=2794934 RepID=UPI0018DD0533|nr:class I SAM-dependent methyltransferase [sulfur-oxidizing endosymbiont of Gigantopelta aegis]
MNDQNHSLNKSSNNNLDNSLDKSFGQQSVSPSQRDQKIRSVFQLVAPRYDLMNDFMSFGTHRIWKRVFVNSIPFKASDIIVDLAGGTGDIARKLQHKGANVVVVDPSIEMMSAGKKTHSLAVSNIAALGERLPFTDASIDKLTISFGIRNMTSMTAALQEIYRVLKPGGQYYCLEFSRPMMPIRPFYNLYNQYIIPRLGALVAGQPEAYQYLIESIQRFPDQETMKALLEDAGFSDVSYRNLFFGIACIHVGTKKHS